MRIAAVFTFALLLFMPIAPLPAQAAVRCANYQYSTAARRLLQTCEAGIPSSVLDRPIVAVPDVQLHSEWCWAASISRVFAYYGHPVSQARIVQEAYGSITNVPGTAQAIARDLNRTWVDDTLHPFRVQADLYSATWYDAANDLARGEPLIVGSLGHAMVVTAVSYYRDVTGDGAVTSVIVRDPWPSNPNRRSLSAAELRGIQILIRIRVAS